MSIHNLQAVILAAGTASRFKTGSSKLTATVCGQELIIYPVRLMNELGIPTTVVVGHDKEKIQEAITRNGINNINYSVQAEQRGTADAAATTRDSWFKDHILILHGDLPLITHDVIEKLWDAHCTTNAAVSIVTAHNADPALQGYARIHQEGPRLQLLESSNSHDHCCVNAGIYLVQKEFLTSVIDQLRHMDAAECSFAHVITLAAERNFVVTPVVVPFDQVRGVNSFQDLWAVEQIKRAELIKHWMEHGVRFSVAQSVHIDLHVTIGAGSSIGSGVHLLGHTKIGAHCTIHEFSSIQESTVGDNCTIYSHTIIKDSCVGNRVAVGPFAHVRDNCFLGNESVIGNFVELKKTTIGERTKAKHLTYLGDAEVGAHVNIGAGTITANHNGFTKNRTIIKDDAYVGANNTLIAPVTVEANAMTAAGSVITDNVPADALAIGRARQVNKEGYAQKLRDRAAGKNNDGPVSFVGARKIDTDSSSMAE